MNLELIGPFRQILTMDNLPLKGALRDDQLPVIEEGGIIVRDGLIHEIGNYATMRKALPFDAKVTELSGDHIAMPGMIDAHTHICWAGSRANDYAMRVAGKSYLEIAEAGGGIWDTVQKTRQASEEELADAVEQRANRMLQEGITTIEVKSGYGLSIEDELKMLRAIRTARIRGNFDIVPTCLAAHMCPKDFDGTPTEYLDLIVEKLLPIVAEEELAHRIDIFIEQSAFSAEEALPYLQKAKEMGFELAVHADQFSISGSKVAVEVGATTAEHLEVTGDEQIELLANSDTIAVALPGCSLGLGDPFTPARKLLDKGAAVAIASDWNPGSAPMGDLLMQASILGAAQHLSCAEVLAGITYRAAAALSLPYRGRLVKGQRADILAFHTNDYREILWNQGKLKPDHVWKNGESVRCISRIDQGPIAFRN